LDDLSHNVTYDIEAIGPQTKNGSVAEISELQLPDPLQLGERSCLLRQTKQSLDELFLSQDI
jgi:hypothetical protein